MKALLATLLTIMLIAAAPFKSIYDFKVKDIDEKEVSLSQYKGKVLLVVNVASLCGNTPQYADIEAMYEKYKDKGLVILGFPANDFMGQEPGSNTEIKQFCSTKYAVKFPMFSKIHVKGSEIAPLYSYLTQKSENGVLDAKVTWNFQKFLVGKDGKVIASFDPKKKVTDESVVSSVEKALAEK
jgi:glutathione peroxidase